MKVIANIPHHDFGISIFAWNQKFLIKFEKNNLEQTYKISELDITGEDDIQAMLHDEVFLNKIAQRFQQMEQDLYEAINNI
jgi:hypothetical protein